MARISTAGAPAWIVSRHAVDVFRGQSDCDELEPNLARRVLSDAYAADQIPPAVLAALVSSGSAAPPRDRGATLQRLLALLEAGELVLFVEAHRAIDPTMPEVRDLLDDAVAMPLESHWIEVQLLDQDGNPQAGERWHATLSDNAEVRGRLDASGCARIPNIPGGTCRWRFPDLSPDAWTQS